MAGGTPSERERLRNLLKVRRQKINLRQIDLAARIDRPQSFISKYESGEKTLDFFELCEVCKGLDIPVLELIKEYFGNNSEAKS